MLSAIRRTIAGLKSNTSGNATLLLAAGIPALIGGSGIAVDTAQWYMWKQELQFAVDQAALAGAWARTNSETTIQDTYKTRAGQEYEANLAATKDFDNFNTTNNVTLATYGASATPNSVIVTASATKALPFSSFLVGGTTTVSVSAQASFSAGTPFTTCMLAVHPTANQAFKFGSSVSGGSTCGAGSLSNDIDAAMVETGNTSVPLGKLVATGGIDDGFANNGSIYENQGGLTDPYASLTTPSSASSTNQTYSCPTARPAVDQYLADGYTLTRYTYTYYQGVGSNNWTKINDLATLGLAASDSNTQSFSDKLVTATTTLGWQTESAATTGSAVKISGNGSNSIWRVTSTTTQDYNRQIDRNYDPGSDGVARPAPGIYASGISIACDTTFQPGIYFVSDLDFGNNRTVIAQNVLFVMTSASSNIRINSNTILDAKGITAAKLVESYGYTATQASKIAGMLFWDKQSSNAFGMEGNANVKIDGVMYMPNRPATFNGNVSAATGGCMMVASSTLTIIGNFNITNFCAPTGTNAMTIGGGTATVKLVG